MAQRQDNQWSLESELTVYAPGPILSGGWLNPKIRIMPEMLTDETLEDFINATIGMIRGTVEIARKNYALQQSLSDPKSSLSDSFVLDHLSGS